MKLYTNISKSPENEKGNSEYLVNARSSLRSIANNKRYGMIINHDESNLIFFFFLN